MAKTKLHYVRFKPRTSHPLATSAVTTITPDAMCMDCGAPLYIGRPAHICRKGYER